MFCHLPRQEAQFSVSYQPTFSSAAITQCNILTTVEHYWCFFFPDKHYLKLFVFAQYIDQACDMDTQVPKSQSHFLSSSYSPFEFVCFYYFIFYVFSINHCNAAGLQINKDKLKLTDYRVCSETQRVNKDLAENKACRGGTLGRCEGRCLFLMF